MDTDTTTLTAAVGALAAALTSAAIAIDRYITRRADRAATRNGSKPMTEQGAKEMEGRLLRALKDHQDAVEKQFDQNAREHGDLHTRISSVQANVEFIKGKLSRS